MKSLLDYFTNEKIWMVNELQQKKNLVVRCCTCFSLYTSDNDALVQHCDLENHDKFIKNTPEVEQIITKLRDEEKELQKHEEEKETKRRKLEASRFTLSDESEKLSEKTVTLKSQLDNNPTLFLGIVTTLSASAQMSIEGVSHPFTIFFTGNATDKNFITKCFKNNSNFYYTNTFTAKSMVSHSPRIRTWKIRENDLLPKIRNKVLFSSNTDALFLGNKPTVTDNISLMDSVLDGNGYESHSAVFANRGYKGDYNFVWSGTITNLNDRLWSSIGMMNNKPLFFELNNSSSNSIDELTNLVSNSDMGESIVEQIKKIWEIFSKASHNGEKHLKWDTENDDKKTIEHISKICIFLSHIRAHIATKNTHESTSGGTNYNFDTPKCEDSKKLMNTLYNLTRGHALLYGRDYLLPEDLEIILHVAISSIPRDRMNILKLLIQKKGSVNTFEIEDQLRVSKATALKEMEKVRLTGIVEDTNTNPTTKPIRGIKLKEQFEWLYDIKLLHTHTV